MLLIYSRHDVTYSVLKVPLNPNQLIYSFEFKSVFLTYCLLLYTHTMTYDLDLDRIEVNHDAK